MRKSPESPAFSIFAANVEVLHAIWNELSPESMDEDGVQEVAMFRQQDLQKKEEA